MPGGDRTGPMGMGVMTGRGAGYCAGFGGRGSEYPAQRRGFKAGFLRSLGEFGRGYGGGGRGRRNMFYATGLPGWMRLGGYSGPYPFQTRYTKPDPEMEKQVLRSQAQILRSELDLIEKRLSEIEPGAKEHQEP
jgi:hypothetical protein